ncbi:hypothetical protein Emag_000169 [Eimeria magna]
MNYQPRRAGLDAKPAAAGQAFILCEGLSVSSPLAACLQHPLASSTHKLLPLCVCVAAYSRPVSSGVLFACGSALSLSSKERQQMLEACCTAHKTAEQQASPGLSAPTMRPPSPQSAGSGSLSPAKALHVECTTWSRDSHGLFDYEARHMNVRRFQVSRPARLFRVGAHVDCVPETAPIPTAAPAGTTATTTAAATPLASVQPAEAAESAAAAGDQQQQETPQTTDFLLSIRCSRDGKYVVMPADRSATGASSAVVTPQKLWSIVREQNDNKHVLQENDVIKLGRYKLRVKQLVAQSSKREDDSSAPPEIPDLRLDDGDPPLSFVASNDMQCRICLLEGNQEDDPLISPCDCKGSIRFVHLECLRHWINGRLNFHEQQHKPIFVRQLLCELCKIPYPTAISYNNERMQVVTVPKTEPPFLVLENMVGSHQKGVHGRGHESDVRIPDVSISRYHATIRFVDGNFQLEDHNSKFGTLVSLRKAFSVGESVAALQVGRSVVKLSISSAPATSEAVVELSEPTPNSSHFCECLEHRLLPQLLPMLLWQAASAASKAQKASTNFNSRSIKSSGPCCFVCAAEVPGPFPEAGGGESVDQQQQQQPQQQQQQHEHEQQQQQQQQAVQMQEEPLALFPVPVGLGDEQAAAAGGARPVYLSPLQRCVIQQQLEREAAARNRQHYFEQAARFSALAADDSLLVGPPPTASLLSDSAASCADGAAATAAAAAATAAVVPFHQSLMQQQLQQFACIGPLSSFEMWHRRGPNAASGLAVAAGSRSMHAPAGGGLCSDGGPIPAAAPAAEGSPIGAGGAGAAPDAAGAAATCMQEDESLGSTPQDMDVEVEAQAAR